MTKRSLTLILLLYAALAVACSDSGLGPEPAANKPEQANKPVLTRLEVAPVRSVLVPESTEQLTVSAWDQFGTKMLDGNDGEWADKATYATSDPEIAYVGMSGLVTAVAPGTATITASLVLSGVTLTSSMLTKVDPPTATSVILTAKKNDGRLWSPYTVSVKAPATVTWVVPDSVQIGTIWLNVWDENAEKLEFVDGVATRKFSTPGSYYYGTGGGLMWYEEGGVIKVY